MPSIAEFVLINMYFYAARHGNMEAKVGEYMAGFLQDLKGSKAWGIMETYNGSSSIEFEKESVQIVEDISRWSSWDTIETVASEEFSSLIRAKKLPLDTNGVYVLVTTLEQDPIYRG